MSLKIESRVPYTFKARGFAEACKSDTPEEIQEFASAFDFTKEHGVAALQSACANKDPAAARLLAELFHIDALSPADADEALLQACVNKRLASVQWLTATFGLSLEHNNIGGALVEACRSGDVLVAQWLAETFYCRRGARCACARAPVGDAMCAASGHNRANALRWLASVFGLGLGAPACCDVRVSSETINRALGDACEEGQLDAAQWLAESFGSSITPSTINGEMRDACNHQGLEAAKWLVATFGGGAPGAVFTPATVAGARRGAGENGDEEMLEWLTSVFGPPTDD